jgi:hypothetical protein
MTFTGGGFRSMPGRLSPGFGPNRESKSMASTSASMTSTLRAMPNFSRSCAASTRSSSTAIRRRARLASNEVRMPRPGPISSTVLCDTSPKASTTRAARSSLARKCCPILGFLCGRRAETTFGTLTLTASGIRLASRSSHPSCGPSGPRDTFIIACAAKNVRALEVPSS